MDLSGINFDRSSEMKFLLILGKSKKRKCKPCHKGMKGRLIISQYTVKKTP